MLNIYHELQIKQIGNFTKQKLKFITSGLRLVCLFCWFACKSTHNILSCMFKYSNITLWRASADISYRAVKWKDNDTHSIVFLKQHLSATLKLSVNLTSLWGLNGSHQDETPGRFIITVLIIHFVLYVMCFVCFFQVLSCFFYLVQIKLHFFR